MLHTYISETRSGSRVGGTFVLGSTHKPVQPIPLNGAILVHTDILKLVVASAAEAELGALFHNCKEGKITRLILQELGHIQPQHTSPL